MSRSRPSSPPSIDGKLNFLQWFQRDFRPDNVGPHFAYSALQLIEGESKHGQ